MTKNELKRYMVCDPGYFLPRGEWQEACRQKDHYKALCELVERHGGKMLGTGDDGAYTLWIRKERVSSAEADIALGWFTVDSGTWAILPRISEEEFDEWHKTHPFGNVAPFSSQASLETLSKDLKVVHEETDDDDEQ